MGEKIDKDWNIIFYNYIFSNNIWIGSINQSLLLIYLKFLIYILNIYIQFILLINL